MKTVEDTAKEAIRFFLMRYRKPQLGAALALKLSGRDVAVEEIAHGERPGRRFWVKIRHAQGTESVAMDMTGNVIVPNLAAPDGRMIRH